MSHEPRKVQPLSTFRLQINTTNGTMTAATSITTATTTTTYLQLLLVLLLYYYCCYYYYNSTTTTAATMTTALPYVYIHLSIALPIRKHFLGNVGPFRAGGNSVLCDVICVPVVESQGDIVGQLTGVPQRPDIIC